MRIISGGKSHMKRRKELEQESMVFEQQTQKLAKGYMDQTIAGEFSPYLDRAAKNINQLTTTMFDYMCEISRVLSHLSVGDLSVKVKDDLENSKGDFGLIENALYKITKSLQNVFEQLTKLSGQVEQVSEQSSYNSMTLAENTQEQTNQISELTEELHRMREKVKENANNMESASKEAIHTKEKTRYGLEQMEKLMTGMQDINQSSQDINGVIQLIQEVANQTKLLSLNASIEAARAGSEGKGFSVVAEEIGKLAVQTSNAVSKTADLIQRNTNTIESSRKLVDNTYTSFQKIEMSVDRIAQIIIDTEEYSKSESNTIDNIASISDRLLDIVQDDAAYAQESAAVSSNLNSQVELLQNVIQQFNLEKTTNRGELTQQQVGTLRKYTSEIIAELGICKDVDQLHQILEQQIRRTLDQECTIECMYVINEQGIQISDTVMNPKIVLQDKEHFKPALLGHNHQAQFYYRVGIQQEDIYFTYEYISTATGGLCRTCTCCYYDYNNNKNILCIDIAM